MSGYLYMAHFLMSLTLHWLKGNTSSSKKSVRSTSLYLQEYNEAPCSHIDLTGTSGAGADQQLHVCREVWMFVDCCLDETDRGTSET